MGLLCFSVFVLITVFTYSDAAQIVSPVSETLSVSDGSDVQLVCHSSPDEGTIVWSYNGMPVDPQSESFTVTTEETTVDGVTVVVNTLVVQRLSFAAGIIGQSNRVTYKCKPQDDILNLDADEVELIITTDIKMRIVEAESSSTLVLPRGDDLVLHCVGELRSRAVWYHNGQLLDLFSNIRIHVGNNIREITMRRWANSDFAGEYQCRDSTGLQADSDVLVVVYAAED